jgi:hypothetical protein
MSSHDVTVAGYLAIAVAGLALAWLAHSGRTAVPTLSEVLARVTRTRAGRVAVIAGWAWLGLHFFAR